ncbi:cytidine deaminase [bacterium]|nr:cytidine deaminase [bacterium]MBU1072390.1 cytidine deaminase [bacterium]MBU1676380.1 cytidine deaminase [bacterium]
MDVNRDALVAAARAAMLRSHSPYSGFSVGAALLGEDGRVYTGTNVENASFGLSICAERTAVFKAVSEGCTAFTACAVATGTAEPTPPCGACRQVLVEFGSDLKIYLAGREDAVEEHDLRDLLPRPFVTFDRGDER